MTTRVRTYAGKSGGGALWCGTFCGTLNASEDSVATNNEALVPSLEVSKERRYEHILSHSDMHARSENGARTMSFVQRPLFQTIKTCPACEIAKPVSAFHRDKSRKDGLCVKCKVCVRAYYDQTRDVQIATTRAWQKAHPDACNAATARWREANSQSCKSANARWVAKNRERLLARNRAYRLAHRDEINALERDKWHSWKKFRPRRRDPAARKAAAHRYRARLIAAEGSFTAGEWRGCKEAHGNRCAICHEVKHLCVDHIIPLSKGGTNYITNIQPLCFSCNSRKKDKMPDDVSPLLHTSVRSQIGTI